MKTFGGALLEDILLEEILPLFRARNALLLALQSSWSSPPRHALHSFYAGTRFVSLYGLLFAMAGYYQCCSPEEKDLAASTRLKEILPLQAKSIFLRALLPLCGMRAGPAGGKVRMLSSRYPALSRSAALRRATERHGLGYVIPRHPALDQRELSQLDSFPFAGENTFTALRENP